MAWYDEAVFYHIYPLGMTGAPLQNDYRSMTHRLNGLLSWIPHLKKLGITALYIGPLFESVGHGYETTDYYKLDTRLGTNEDLKNFVAECHREGIRVILDGVFNHTGRDFFAFQDIKEKREGSRYRDWYCNVNFGGNNEYNDGFSYENWGGYNLLVKLNQRNPEVIGYICDVVRFWVREFDIDGIRLDAADVLDFEFMRALRNTAREVKEEFWLMGEVIHGDYSRWVNEGTLHSVTNYQLHKALYSGHNDHNYFEIAHTVRRLYEMGGNRPGAFRLYNFVDNHDVERIYTKLINKAHFVPAHVLLYTLPGIPSIYYGSEFGIEGRKERGSDASLRPELHIEDYQDAFETNPCTMLIAQLGRVKKNNPALTWGDYREVTLTTRQYAFTRTLNGDCAAITVNNDDNSARFHVPVSGAPDGEYEGAVSGNRVHAENGWIDVEIAGNYGDVWVPAGKETKDRKKEAVKKTVKAFAKHAETEKTEKAGNTGRPAETVTVSEKESGKSVFVTPGAIEAKEEEKKQAEGNGSAASVRADISEKPVPQEKSLEEMTVEELQAVIYRKMAHNGPVTDQMKRDIENNIWHDSLVNWAKSFR